MKSTVLLLYGILFLLGCGSDEEIAPTETEPIDATLPNYFPDELASRWVYRTPDGSLYSREITREQTLSKNVYHVFDYTPPIKKTDFPFLKPTFFRVTQNRVFFNVSEMLDAIMVPPETLQAGFEGVETSMTIESISEDELLFCHIPLRTNFQWEALSMKLNGTFILQDLLLLQFPFEMNVSIEAQVDDEMPLQTPAGIFEKTYQIVYQTEITATKLDEVERTEKYTQKVWIAPHVGIVKLEDESGVTELIKYVLPP